MADGYRKTNKPEESNQCRQTQNNAKKKARTPEEKGTKAKEKSRRTSPGTAQQSQARIVNSAYRLPSTRENNSRAARLHPQAIQKVNGRKSANSGGIQRGGSCGEVRTSKQGIRHGSKGQKHSHGNFSIKEPLRFQGRRPGRGSRRTEQGGAGPGNFGTFDSAVGAVHGPGRGRRLCSFTYWDENEAFKKLEVKDCTNCESKGSCTAPEIQEIIEKEGFKVIVCAPYFIGVKA